MTLEQFRAKCYEILEKKGHEEINGVLYYPESAIMDLVEFIRNEKITIEETALDNKLSDLTALIKNLTK